MRRLALLIAPLLGLLVIRATGGCDNGTTTIAIPVLEASVPEGGTVFTDGAVGDAVFHVPDGAFGPDVKSHLDATSDAKRIADAGSDGSHETDAHADGPHDAASDVRSPDAADGAG